MALPPGTRFGSYEVVGPIGAGGMGEVYHARDTRLDRDVAIKVLPDGFAADAERVARFDREARTLASLSHPNIAAVYGFEPVGDSNALVLEYIEGPTLADRIAQGPVPLDEAIAIILQVADALGAAHDQGIVHRDLKPANIKVRPDGSVKVLDFGLAKAFLPDATGKSGSVSMSPTITTPAMTAHGVIMGTAAYMAPEQAKGRPVGKRADLWALGCVLFEMLSGQRPFDGEDMTEVLASVIKSEPDWTRLPAGLPPAVLRLVRDCLEKDPRRRIADASVVRYVLEHPVGGAASASVAAPKARAGWRTWAAAAAALAAVTAAAVFGTMAFTTPVLKPYRLAVVPSAGQPFVPTGTERDLAVTPDGRQIIYRTYVGETSKLVVRDANADDGRILEGTDGARGPFVSPDGLWVGYFSAGSLKKVLVTGGPSVTLCATTGASRGGSWAGDTIVFATNDVTTGLMRVPAAGGVPTVISRPDTAAGETDHGFPWLMPDGSHALFSMIGPDGAALASIDLETQERKVLLRDGSRHAQYLTDGILLFEQGGALRAARFDASRMELTSDPVPVVERVGSAVALPSYAVSGDGLLVYVPGRASTGAGRTMVWVSPDGREEPLKIDGRNFADPRLSADDRQAVVEINDALLDVWTLDLTRGTVTRQSFEPGEDETSAWMPDGRTLVYASTRPSVGRAIFRRRADGVGSEDPIWTGPGHAHVEAITPNGTAMIFSQAAVNGGQMDLMLLPLDGSGKVSPLLQTPFNEFGARLSPDGRAVAYVSNESGRPEVYLRSFPSLEGKVQVSTNGATQPVWSRRGDELYFVSTDAMLAARVQSGATLTVGQPRKLFDNQYYSKGLAHTGYDVARDGRFLMVKEPPQGQDGSSNNLLVVLNWFEELKEKLR